MPKDVWFTSDFHLGHSRIIGYCSRPAGDISEMDEMIIERINQSVRENDQLYFLGDFCLGKAEQVEKYFRRIRCRSIYFVRGNHDKGAVRVQYLFRWFKDLAEVNFDKRQIVLCHYPMRAWRESHYGSWHLHGHTHGRLPEDPLTLSMDVGVDTHDYRPWHWDEIVARLRPKEEQLRAQGRFRHRFEAADF